MNIERETESKLTDYESHQVEAIAAWKSSHPNPFGEMLRRVAHPIASFIEHKIPDTFADYCIKTAYHSAETASNLGDIKKAAGVTEITELRHKNLEECDRLSHRVGLTADVVATVEGALTGAGGVITTVLDIPLLFTLCLRTIIKTGHCYGYPLDRPTDKAWVLGAFAVALSHTKSKRVQLTMRLREIEDLLIEDTQEQVIVEEALSLVTQLEVFEAIPLLGIIGGAVLNLLEVHKMDVTARHLFQERWLRDNGKLEVIEPLPDDATLMSHLGWKGTMARAGKSTAFGLGFGAAFPVYFVAAIWNSVWSNRKVALASA